MKNFVLAALCFTCMQCLHAQDEQEEKKGFKKENFFAGGSISLAFSNGAFGIGGNPEFGYSLAKWVDLGIVGNYNYSSYRNYPIQGYVGTLKQTIYGGGLFTRIFPVRFIFLQAQIEHNWITQKYIVSGLGTVKDKVSANSFLVGAGYTTGRNADAKSPYAYFSILVDVLKEDYSPYVGYDYDNNGNVVDSYPVPIIRAGFIVPLFQGRGRNER